MGPLEPVRLQVATTRCGRGRGGDGGREGEGVEVKLKEQL